MPATDTIRVQGFRELQRAYKIAGASVHRGLRKRLQEVGEPVRADAERLAVQGIRRIGIPWSRMRVGVRMSDVYVAPRQRGRLSRANPKLRRPNLADLLMDRSMEPALENNKGLVVEGFERLLDEVGNDWESA